MRLQNDSLITGKGCERDKENGEGRGGEKERMNGL